MKLSTLDTRVASGCAQELFDGVNTVVIDYGSAIPNSIRDGIAAPSGLKFRITGAEKWNAEAITPPRR
ncbi:hypothetical protein [Mesorhizobium sp.]|uniref:hypothetical protein n=1 Tax=Mesorhizobium sp. TaxID=1871066 RepID=UPI000FE9D679|nr:hypothetical protein [Mesorhizobium sp.]RWP02699.1 MAG: hypothetical protein EOQ99_22655 [Mesorhizobium sp.]